MDSRTPTEEYRDDTSAAFEVVRVLGRQLQASKERIKALEEALSELRTATMVVDSKPDQQLLERVREAEAKKCQLKAENDNLRNDQEKQSLRMEELQVKLDAATASFNQERETAALLQGRVKALDQEKTSLTLECVKSQKSFADFGVQLRNIRELERPWSIEQYVEFSDDDQGFRGRPDYVSLQPVCDRGTDLKLYMEEDKQLRWAATSFICLSSPHRLVWTSTSCQVGLAFGPMHVYEGSDGWKEHSVFSEYDGKDVEVFFEDEQHTFYAGSYTFERIRDRNPQGCLQQSAESAKELSLASINLPASYPGTKSKRLTQALQHPVESLYTQGILKAECTILRCVGFNQEIHDRLSARYKRAKELKRKANTEADSGHKRRRGP
ncbi:hypothetical protein FA13DRAFT_1731891 [Coprinellus micaceus]|uniref:Uncharacterized protein n=1 Tax=Coprinellus micaceus TaxID=71717 RepID=A0A4Y7TDX3_COPMI|nr:hypothetical protein FA13DRAFT_1731891 [Coprinellus micaceus]